MKEHDYLRSFERRDLMDVANWKPTDGRAAAQRMFGETNGAPLILLGKKVTAAFDRALPPWHLVQLNGSTVLSLPHPSGLCREWYKPGMVERARDAVVNLVPELAPHIGMHAKAPV